ncbi:MAG: hypothetical protein AABZ34_03445 [Nitrospirota bacterium]
MRHGNTSWLWVSLLGRVCIDIDRLSVSNYETERQLDFPGMKKLRCATIIPVLQFRRIGAGAGI